MCIKFVKIKLCISGGAKLSPPKILGIMIPDLGIIFCWIILPSHIFLTSLLHCLPNKLQNSLFYTCPPKCGFLHEGGFIIRGA